MFEKTFYYTSEDDCIPYHFGRSADKSAAAKRREEKAMEMFSKTKIQMETRQDLIPGSFETVKLLNPSCHLTGPCWSSFSKHVRSQPGWTAKRRAITDEEKKLWGETRKGKCYFVDVTYTVPIPKKRPAEQEVESNKLVKQCDESSDSII